MVEGSFTGKTDHTSVSNGRTGAGINVPRGKISQSGYRIHWRDNPTGISNEFPVVAHILRLAIFPSGSIHGDNILTPEELWNIDTKTDDGRPGLGNVRISGHNNLVAPTCATTIVAETAEYPLTDTSTACIAHFLLLN